MHLTYFFFENYNFQFQDILDYLLMIQFIQIIAYFGQGGCVIFNAIFYIYIYIYKYIYIYIYIYEDQRNACAQTAMWAKMS